MASGILPDWVLSEDSFLNRVCHIESETGALVYDWVENVENPKLHFVRILQDQMPLPYFEQLVARWKPHFESRGLSFCIKASAGLLWDPKVAARLERWPPNLNFWKVRPRQKSSSRPELRIERARSLATFHDWWLLYSTFPTREEKMRSPFLPYARACFEAGTEFHVAYRDNQALAGFALDFFEDSAGAGALNMWGVATLESEQKRGLYRELEYRVLTGRRESVYLQTLENSPLDLYYRKEPSNRLLTQQLRYRMRTS